MHIVTGNTNSSWSSFYHPRRARGPGTPRRATRGARSYRPRSRWLCSRLIPAQRFKIRCAFAPSRSITLSPVSPLNFAFCVAYFLLAGWFTNARKSENHNNDVLHAPGQVFHRLMQQSRILPPYLMDLKVYVYFVILIVLAIKWRFASSLCWHFTIQWVSQVSGVYFIID